MADHRIGIEVNKELAAVAFVACAIGIGVASAIWGIMNPLIAGGVAGVIGFAVTYANKGLGVMAIIAAAAIFLLALFTSGS